MKKAVLEQNARWNAAARHIRAEKTERPFVKKSLFCCIKGRKDFEKRRDRQ